MADLELRIPELTVRLLGGAAIEQNGLPLSDRAAHRHALGLLALLATARGRLIARDKVVALLWPDSSADMVRHRLNVLLHDLRRILGRHAIVSVNDALRLDTDLVWVDVVQVAAALQEGAVDEAAALYRGDFLDGFHLAGAQEFDQWIAAERERLASALRAGLEQQAMAADKGRDAEAAVRRWKRLVELDPLATRSTLGLMRALAARGDVHAAFLIARAHALRREELLETGPDPTVEALAAELRDAGPPPTFRTEPAPADSGGGDAIDVTVRQSKNVVPDGHRPARVSPGRAFGALGVAAVILLLLLWPRLRDRGATASGEGAARSATDLVILPFTIHGAERHHYLGDGMAELLSITLDGAGPLRTADPHAVLAHVRRRGIELPDPRAASLVAARFDASHFVLGSVVESGEKLELRATLYSADATLRATAVGSVSPAGDVTAVVDTLTRQLIASLYPRGVERQTRLAVATSASLPALKSYLEGERHVRSGEHSAAVDAYRQATEADSSFSLAWYRLAVALEVTLQPRAAAEAAESAVRHAARLPERDRLLLEGWRTWASGQSDEAEAIYRRVLDLNPGELDAWLQLGEIGFHHAASRGEEIAVSKEPFERVLALDPDHEAAHVHLARIAGQQKDSAALARHTGYLVARRPGTGVALEMAALRAFASGDQARVAALRPDFQREDSYTAVALLMSMFHAGDMAGMEWCADLLSDSQRPVEAQTAGHIVRALLGVSRGEHGAAMRAVEMAERLDADRGLESRALILTLPFIESDLAEVARVRDALAGVLKKEVKESFFLPDADRVRPAMRLYLLGLLHSQLGDSAATRRVAQALDAMPTQGRDSALHRDLATAVRAEAARRSGDEGTALALLETIGERPAYQLVLPSPFEPRARERFVRAELLKQLGRRDEARALYAGIGARSLYDLPYRAPSQARLARGS